MKVLVALALLGLGLASPSPTRECGVLGCCGINETRLCSPSEICDPNHFTLDKNGNKRTGGRNPDVPPVGGKQPPFGDCAVGECIPNSGDQTLGTCSTERARRSAFAFFFIILGTWLVFLGAAIRNCIMAEQAKQARARRAKQKAAGKSDVTRLDNQKKTPGSAYFKRVADLIHKSEGFCDYIEEARYQLTAISKLTDQKRSEATTRFRAFAIVFHRTLHDGRWIEGVLPADYSPPPKIDNRETYAQLKGTALAQQKAADEAAEMTRLRAIEEHTIGGTQKAFVMLETLAESMLVIVQAPSVTEVEKAFEDAVLKFDELAALLPEQDADLALDWCQEPRLLLAAEQLVIDEEYFFDKTDHGVREHGKRVKKPCCNGVFQFDLRHQLFFIIYFGLYASIVMIHVFFRLLKKKEGNESLLFTFLGLGPQYDMDNNRIQLLAIPVLYGVMHASLYTLTLTPLPFARGIWRDLVKCNVGVRNYLPVDDLIKTHRLFGLILIGGIATGASIWVLVMGFSCFQGIPASCLAFHPDVKDYFNPLENVLFLRQLVWICWFGVIPWLEFRNERPPKWCCWKFQQYFFEILHYTHVFVAFLVVILALIARFPVFVYILAGWGPYVADKLRERIYHTHLVGIVLKIGDNTEMSSRIHMHSANNKPVSIHTVLTLPKNYKSNAGQWIFLHVPRIDRSWHPFSLASASGSPTINLEIGVRGWPEKDAQWVELENEIGVKEWDQPKMTSWTFKLYRYIRTVLHEERDARRNNQGADISTKHLPRGMLKRDADTIHLKALVKGPYGAAYEQCVHERFGCSVIMGAGTGVTSALSGLREIVARRADDRPVPPLVWFVWTTQSVDDLLWLWESVSITIYNAVVSGVIIPHKKFTKSAKTMDWLGMTVYISKGDHKLLSTFVQGTEPMNVEGQIVHAVAEGVEDAQGVTDKVFGAVTDVTGVVTGAVTDVASTVANVVTGGVAAAATTALSVFKKAKTKEAAEESKTKREGKKLTRVEVHQWMCDDKRLLLNSMDDKATHIVKLLKFVKLMIGPEPVSVSYCGPGDVGFVIADACKECGPSYEFVQDTL